MKDFPSWIQNQLPDKIKRDYFESSFGNIHYLTRGSGQKVFLLHGNPTWSFLWRKVMNELSEDSYEVIAPDLLNLGFSDSLNAKDFNMENHVSAFTEFFDQMDIEDAIFVVQDWGGPIGLASLARLKSKVKGLVILNTGFTPPKPPYRISKFHSFVNKKFLPDLLFNKCGYPMYSLHKTQFDKSTISGRVGKAYRYPMRQNRDQWTSALKFARMVPNSNTHPSFSLFEDIEVFCRSFQGPVEAVWGIKDPILGKGVKKLNQVFEKITIEQVDAGHFLQEECPTQIANAIQRVFKKSTNKIHANTLKT